MGLLPVTTELGEQKVRTRVGGEILGGMLDGCELSGYEIHMGISRPEGTANLSAGSATRLPGRSARTASLQEMCAAPTCTAF